MSSVVGETSTSFSSQPPKPKSGAPGQSSNDNGFSGLVDSNLAAAADDSSVPAPKAKAPASQDAPQPSSKPRTGANKNKSSEPDQAAPAPESTQPAEDATIDATVDVALKIKAVVTTGVIAKDATPEPVETGPDPTTETAPATTGAGGNAMPGVTGIVPVAAVQIELAVAPPDSVVNNGDAIPAANAPGTAVAPAGTAANALAKVAADTAEAQAVKVEATAESEIPATGTDAQKPAAETKAKAEIATLIEAVVPETQVEAKAKAELPGAAKVIATPQTSKSEPAELDPQGPPKVASAPQEPVTASKPDTPATPAVEARKEQTATADKPAEADALPSPRPQEQTIHAAVPAHVTNAEQPQPAGLAFSHLAALQTTGTPLPTASLTATPAMGMPVPVQGLAVEIAANVQIGRSRFEIRLDPPELGRIDVRLDVDKQGQVTSHLIVEKSTTLDLLRRDAPQLERALQDAGLKTSDNGLQFSLRDQQQSGRNNDDGSQRNAHRLIVTEDETVAVETAGRSYGRMIGQRGGIDIRV